MSEQNPTGPNTGSDIGDEIRTLGKNLEGIFRTFWESEERQRIQREVSDGLTEVGDNLRQAAHEFSQSETGQRLKSDVEGIHQRVESGELQDKARTEFLNVLQRINRELEQASDNIKKQSDSGPSSDPGNRPEA